MKRISVCLAASAAVTGILLFADSQRRSHQETSFALGWARQVTAQAEGIIFAGREKGEADPVRWAASLLTQGFEHRPLKISKVLIPQGTPAEGYQILPASNGGNRIFEYTRVFRPEESSGLRIEISLEERRFLGIQSRLTADLTLFSIFIFGFLALFFALKRPDHAVKERALDWVQEMKNLLVQLGTHVREMVREAQNLAVATGKSRGTISGLRERIHSGLNGIIDGKTKVAEARKAANQAEAVALNLVIEAARVGEQGRTIGLMAEEIHRQLRELKACVELGEEAVRGLEIGLEPIATDADLAFHAYDEVFKATKTLDSHIRKTTETMVAQARTIKSIKGDLDAEDPAQSTPAAQDRLRAAATK